jgi:PAS domain S-box-containing protein
MRALKRGTPVSGTVLGVFNPQTQSRVWVEVNATPEFHPGEPMPYQVLVTLHDVTERKRSEALIQESEERFRRTFDQAPIGAAIVSLDYRFLRVNPAMCRITGYTEEQLLARRFSDIAPRDGLADDIAQAQRLLTGEIEQYSREKRNIRPNKDTVWVNVSVRLLRDVHGQPLHYLAMIEDITSRKLAEEQQQRLQQQLAHVSRLSTLGEMAAGIAHDVNQPLYSILNYAKACSNLLKQINPQNDKLLEWNAQIAAEATRAGEIIKRMRGFARKEAVRRLPTRVQEVIEESLSLIACETRRLRVKVRKDFAESVLLASCDRIQIQQVVINLLRNACEALEQRTEDERRVMIRTAMAQEFIEVVIADNGPGLQGVEAATIFDAFVTSKPAGLGMGLAISKSIVEAHGGRIWVTTTSEGGASLHFTLPSTLGERGNV